MPDNIKHDQIDATGLTCPLPLLKVKQWLAQASTGDQLVIRASDPGSARDIPRFLAATPHRLTVRNDTPAAFCAEIEVH